MQPLHLCIIFIEAEHFENIPLLRLLNRSSRAFFSNEMDLWWWWKVCLFPGDMVDRANEDPRPQQAVRENDTASAFPVATRLELVDKSCCGVSERTTIKWNHFLTFRRFPAACCRELQFNYLSPVPCGLSSSQRAQSKSYSGCVGIA